MIFSLQLERSVNRDNTVSFQNLNLQIERVSWRGTLAGCSVVVHQHLDGHLSLTYGPHWLGALHRPGRTDAANKNRGATGCGRLNRETGHFTCYEKRTFSLANNSPKVPVLACRPGMWVT